MRVALTEEVISVFVLLPQEAEDVWGAFENIIADLDWRNALHQALFQLIKLLAVGQHQVAQLRYALLLLKLLAKLPTCDS